jgi:hypothetical protein
LVAATLAACSSSSSSPSGASGDGGASSSGSGGDANGPRVTLAASVLPGTHGTDCKQTTDLDVGTFDPSAPVAHQQMWNGGTALVVCRVAPAGSGFTVASSVTVGGSGNGSFELAGNFDSTGATQAGLHIVFGAGGSYAGMTCTAKYTQPTEGVAAGRIWTDFDCPAVTDNGQGSTCEMHGQVRFENCLQQ